MIATRLDRPDLRIWIAAGVVALAAHAGFALKFVAWHDPVAGDDSNEAVLVDLAPLMQQPQIETPQDLAPGPLQEEAPAEPVPPKETPQVPERIEPLPAVPNAEAVLPKPAERPVEKAKVRPKPAAPATTAPPRPRPSAAQVSNWHRQIVIQLERHKNYPASARAQQATGAATVTFTIGRDGRLLSSRLVQSSHAALLDEAALATVRRASPFPPPPANMAGARFDFTVPIRFNIR
jgi:protein TonB